MKNFITPVVETLQQSGIDPAECVIIGGAALALHGVRAAADVDLIVNPLLFEQYADAGETPSGIRLKRKTAGLFDFRLLSTSPPGDDCLALDLNTTSGRRRLPLFVEYQKHAEVYNFGGGALLYTELSSLIAEKSQSFRFKDRLDVRRIRHHLKAQTDRLTVAG